MSENINPEGDSSRIESTDDLLKRIPPTPAPSLVGTVPSGLKSVPLVEPTPETPSWKQVVRHPLVVGALVAVAVGVGSGVVGYVAGWNNAISDSVAHHNAFHKGKEVGEAEVIARDVSIEEALQRWLESGRTDDLNPGSWGDGEIQVGHGISDTLPVVEERLGNFVIPERTSLPKFVVTEDGKIVTARDACSAAGGELLLSDPPQCTEPLVVTGLVVS